MPGQLNSRAQLSRQAVGVPFFAIGATASERVDFRDVSREPQPNPRGPSAAPDEQCQNRVDYGLLDRFALLTSNFIPCQADKSTSNLGLFLPDSVDPCSFLRRKPR